MEQTLASLRADYDERILSAVTEACKEEKRKAEQSREQLTSKLNEEKHCAIVHEKWKRKEVEQQVEQMKMVSCFKTKQLKIGMLSCISLLCIMEALLSFRQFKSILQLCKKL